MAKIDINFNNQNYSIDESALSSATAALKSHLSTVMNGTGATINLDGTSYSIDATKLATATNAFVTHLGTVSGSGYKVKVGGVEYGVDSGKMAGAVAELEEVLAGLNSGVDSSTLEGDGQEFYTLAPSTLTFRSTEPLADFQEVRVNGQVVDSSNYTLEEGSTIVKLSIDYLKTLPVGAYDIEVVSANNAPSGVFTVAAPELNEHGFYYNQPYSANLPMFGGDTAFFVREDGTYDIITVGKNPETGEYTMSGNNIVATHPALGTITCTISSDGTEVFCNELQVAFKLSNSTAIAADEDYVYVYMEDLGGYEVKCIDKTKAEYGAIKTGINGIDTVKLADEMFYHISGVSSTLTNIEIPSGILEIGDYALKNCENLDCVIIPDSVTTIGDSAFDSCTSLRSVIIPDSVTSIGESAFANANLSKLFEISGSLSSISNHTFSHSILKNITIKEGVTSIGDAAFSNCIYLASIDIPESVTSIGSSALYSCSSLFDITYNGTISQWKAIEKGQDWDKYTAMKEYNQGFGGGATFNYRNYTVHCIDGDFDSNGIAIS